MACSFLPPAHRLSAGLKLLNILLPKAPFAALGQQDTIAWAVTWNPYMGPKVMI